MTNETDEQLGRAIVWWARFRSAWFQIGAAYKRDAAGGRAPKRRNPYIGARDAMWSAAHGKKDH